jgi:hypothetical protein
MQPFFAFIVPMGSPSDGGVPTHPIVLPPGTPPGVPAHPIANPPGTGPSHPIVPPGGYPHPEHPIVIPPGATPPDPPPTGPLGALAWSTIWTEQTGWAVIGVPTGPHPTPSQ